MLVNMLRLTRRCRQPTQTGGTTTPAATTQTAWPACSSSTPRRAPRCARPEPWKRPPDHASTHILCDTCHCHAALRVAAGWLPDFDKTCVWPPRGLNRPQQILLRLTLPQLIRLQPLDQYDEERTVFIHDWFHTQGDVLAMSLNRRAVSEPKATTMSAAICPALRIGGPTAGAQTACSLPLPARSSSLHGNANVRKLDADGLLHSAGRWTPRSRAGSTAAGTGSTCRSPS